MTELRNSPWVSLGYEPVGPIINKLIARYLRTQRKNMRRFFQERGLYTLADRMDQIRKSRQGMLEKNRMFQKVLNDYSALTTNPGITPVDTAATPAVRMGGAEGVPAPAESPYIAGGETEASNP